MSQPRDDRQEICLVLLWKSFLARRAMTKLPAHRCGWMKRSGGHRLTVTGTRVAVFVNRKKAECHLADIDKSAQLQVVLPRWPY